MNDMYLVTATGTKDGKPYSTLTRVVQGEKANGDRYTFLDINKTIREQSESPFGELVEYQTTRIAKKQQ